MGRRGSGVKPWGTGIQISFTYRTKRLRPTLDLPPTPPNLKYAARLRAEIQDKIRHGTFDYATYFPDAKNSAGLVRAPSAFREVAKLWLASKPDMEHATRISYERLLESVWFPAFGDKDVRQIRYSDIQSVLAEMPGSPKTRNNKLIPVRGVFEFAFLDKMIQENPASAIRNAKVQIDPPDPLELHEVDTVLAKLPEGHIRNYFEFAFFTGLRPSEQIALLWSDVDLGRGIVRVGKARVWGRDKATTKTHKVRDVELTGRAREALERQRVLTQLAGGAVFYNPNTGQAWNDEQVQRRYWTAALVKAKIRHREQYQTRHTFATLGLMAGANPAWISRQMGHASAQMLFRVYARWIEGADHGRERGKFDAAVGVAAKKGERQSG